MEKTNKLKNNMKKTQTKTKTILEKVSFWTLAILIPAMCLAKICWATAVFVDNPVPTSGAVQVIVPKDKNELSMKEWVLNEFRKNGLNPAVADCVIQQESGWNDQRLPSATNDFGLMQWNIQHIKSGLLDMSCAYDYKCSVRKAIDKIKKDGTWYSESKKSWYGWKDANCGRFGDAFIK